MTSLVEPLQQGGGLGGALSWRIEHSVKLKELDEIHRRGAGQDVEVSQATVGCGTNAIEMS